MQSCIMHLDNVLGRQVDVGIMTDNAAGMMMTTCNAKLYHAP